MIYLTDFFCSLSLGPFQALGSFSPTFSTRILRRLAWFIQINSNQILAQERPGHVSQIYFIVRVLCVCVYTWQVPLEATEAPEPELQVVVSGPGWVLGTNSAPLEEQKNLPCSAICPADGWTDRFPLVVILSVNPKSFALIALHNTSLYI